MSATNVLAAIAPGEEVVTGGEDTSHRETRYTTYL